MTHALAGLLAMCLSASVFAQTPPRDVGRSAQPGDARILGLVTSDEADPRPLRRVRVTLNGTSLPADQQTVTNDDGTFMFSGLPFGRYTVSAAKNAFVSMNHGATRPGRPGTGIVLSGGESRSVTIRLPRGSVITGVITDSEGQPLPGAGVSLFQRKYSAAAGERRLVPVSQPPSVADDRGVYRIFGLAAGQYIVVALNRSTDLPLQTVSPAEVRRALADVRSTVVDTSKRLPSTLTPTTAYESKSGVAMAPVYYPGTTVASQASVVSVGPGEERAGIDFQLESVPTATVSGTLPGTTPGSMVSLVRRDDAIAEGFRRSGVDPAGKFVFPGVTPGQYTVTTLARGSAKTEPAQWASADVTVDGQDVSVALTFQPTITIAGRLVFEGTRPAPLPMLALAASWPLPLSQSLRANPIPLPNVQVEAGGRFTIPGIVPGLYRSMAMQAIRTPIGSWWLKSIVLNGRDLLDAQLDLTRSAADAVVTFSDRASELTGTVTGSDGQPRSDWFVVAFSTNKDHWFFNSRRVVGARPDQEGRYRFRNLPPGDYFITVADVDQGEWFDPEMLEGLAASAGRITLGEDEQKKLDLPHRAGM